MVLWSEDLFGKNLLYKYNISIILNLKHYHVHSTHMKKFTLISEKKLPVINNFQNLVYLLNNYDLCACCACILMLLLHIDL